MYRSPPTHRATHHERPLIEEKILATFGDAITPVEEAGDIIRRFKGKNFAMSQMGMMLYTNGHSLRGTSEHHRNGLLYYDGQNIFGIGFFAKEGEVEGHLMLVAPHGSRVIAAVHAFINRLRAQGICDASIYVRHLQHGIYEEFLASGMVPAECDPWHPQAIREDEYYPNRVYTLRELLQIDPEGRTIFTLKKSRLSYNRFLNFLKRNRLVFTLEPYTYSAIEKITAASVVERYFRERGAIGNMVGSTPEDYFALVDAQPQGINGSDYFAYLGYVHSVRSSYLVAFFAGERLGGTRVGLYATLTSRFPADRRRLPLVSETGYTALSQYAYLRVFEALIRRGIDVVDVGGSETEGLDRQKRQLGGKPEQSYWAILLPA